MKKMTKLIPLSVGMALMVLAGSAFAATPNTEKMQSTTNSTEVKSFTNLMGKVGVKLGHHFELNNEDLLALLKLDRETLKSELSSGKSLADITAAKGVDKQKVIDLLLKNANENIDAAIKDGKLTEEQATQLKEKLKERISEQVESTGGFMMKHHGMKARGGHHLNAVAAILGLSEEELHNQLMEGKSLSEIAKEKGITEQSLIDSLVTKEKERISSWVKEKRKTDSTPSSESSNDSL